MTTARDNPFRAARLDALEFRFSDSLADSSWDELLARLETLKFRAAIIGKHGRGKTTLLDQIAPHLKKHGWKIHRLQLNTARRDFSRAQWRSFSSLGAHDFLLLDGAEQLSTLRWKFLCWKTRQAGGLLITTHRPGRLPTLMECQTSPGLLLDLARVLAPQCALDENSARVLFVRHGGNIRDALRELYDLEILK